MCKPSGQHWELAQDKYAGMAAFQREPPVGTGRTKPLPSGSPREMQETKLLHLLASASKEARHQDENCVKTKLQIDKAKRRPRKWSLGHVSSSLDKNMGLITAGSLGEANIALHFERGIGQKYKGSFLRGNALHKSSSLA